MKIFFARHGESEANVLHMISNRDAPHCLTAAGRAQARELAQSLQGAGISRIFASPIVRASQTAAIVSEALGAPWEQVDALREPDCGVMEGRSDDEAWAAHHAVSKAWHEDGRLDARIPGGESFQDVTGRFVPWIESLVAEHAGTDACFLIVSHGSVMRCSLPLLLSNIHPTSPYDLDFTYARAIETAVSNGRLFCLKWNGLPVPT